MWWAYRQKYGSLFFGRRIEQAVGYLRSDVISVAIRKEQDPFNYMPHEPLPEEVEYSVDEMFEKGLSAVK